jgi:hypothetical protein
MKVATPIKKTALVDQDRCAKEVREGRAASKTTIYELADALEVSPTKMWLLLRGGRRCKWTPELFEKAMHTIAAKMMPTRNGRSV